MIHVDGARQEGGGQIVRTAVSLATITGQPIYIDRIRAGRARAGLSAQHLSAVRAAATICQARVRGDELGSMELEFVPSRAPRAGNYLFDVAGVREGGSAGAVTLILQTILLPLALAAGDSVVVLRGGTHVPLSPSVTYVEQVYLPMLNRLGVRANLELQAWGWYPRGNGEVILRVTGGAAIVRGLRLLDRGSLLEVRGLAVVTELPSHIPQRMANRAKNLLQELKTSTRASIKIEPSRAKGTAPGAGIFLSAEYENSLAGFGALGRLGLAAEKVAEIAVNEFLDFHASNRAVDLFLADQLLLPASLAKEESEYNVDRISSHLQTNAETIAQFNLARISIDEDSRIVRVIPTRIG